MRSPSFLSVSAARSALLAAPLIAGLAAPAGGQDRSADRAEEVSNAIGWVLDPGTAVDNIRLGESARYHLVFHGVSVRGVCSVTLERYRHALSDALSNAQPAPLESSDVSVPHGQPGTVSWNGSPVFSVACDAKEGVLVVDPVSADSGPSAPFRKPSPHIPYNIMEMDAPGSLPRIISI